MKQVLAGSNATKKQCVSNARLQVIQIVTALLHTVSMAACHVDDLVLFSRALEVLLIPCVLVSECATTPSIVSISWAFKKKLVRECSHVGHSDLPIQLTAMVDGPFHKGSKLDYSALDFSRIDWLC